MLYRCVLEALNGAGVMSLVPVRFVWFWVPGVWTVVRSITVSIAGLPVGGSIHYWLANWFVWRSIWRSIWRRYLTPDLKALHSLPAR